MNQYTVLNRNLNVIGFLSLDNGQGSTAFWGDSIVSQIADDDSSSDDLSTLSQTINEIDTNANHKLWNHTININVENTAVGKQIDNGYYLLYTDTDNTNYLMYLYDVTEDTDVSGKKFRTINGSNSAIYDGSRTILKAKTFTQASLADIVSYIQGSYKWSFRIPDDDSIKINYEISDNTTVQSVLQDLLIKFDIEARAYVELNNSGQIAKRIVELGTQGIDKGDLIRYGSPVKGFESISQQYLSDTLYTKLYVTGKDGSSIATVNQSNTFVVDDEANELYNPVGAKNGMYLEGTIENTVLSEPQALLTWAKKQLTYLNHPRANYTVTALHDMTNQLGDTVRVQDLTASPVITVSSRVIQRTLSFGSPETNTIVLGEFSAMEGIKSNPVIAKINSLDIDVDLVRAKAENAVTVAGNAKDEALSATKSAQGASAMAETAKTMADDATQSAKEAQSDAIIAQGQASEAHSYAVVAEAGANEAKAQASSATSQANIATGYADEAKTQANTAYSQATIARSSADEASSLASQASSDLVAVKSKANTAYDLANTAEVLAGVAQKGVRDGIATAYVDDLANLPSQVTVKYSDGSSETRDYKAGDTAYVTKDGVTKIYTYDGTSWVQPSGSIAPASITTNMISAGAITAGLIDTESLATNEAFISQLVTTNLDVKDSAGTEIVANGSDGLLVKKSDGTVLLQAKGNSLVINGGFEVSNTPLRNFMLDTYQEQSVTGTGSSLSQTLYSSSVTGKVLGSRSSTAGMNVYLAYDWSVDVGDNDNGSSDIATGSFSLKTSLGNDLFTTSLQPISLTSNNQSGTVSVFGKLDSSITSANSPFDIVCISSNLNGTIVFDNFRLMITNDTQDWILAPEDYSAQLNQLNTQLNDTITTNVNTVNNNISTVSNNLDNITTEQEKKWQELNGYVKIDNGTITLGNNTNQSQVVIDNDEIDFNNGGNTVAKLTGKSLAITDTDASLQLGSFQFQPRENGNLSFTWVE